MQIFGAALFSCGVDIGFHHTPAGAWRLSQTTAVDDAVLPRNPLQVVNPDAATLLTLGLPTDEDIAIQPSLWGYRIWRGGPAGHRALNERLSSVPLSRL